MSLLDGKYGKPIYRYDTRELLLELMAPTLGGGGDLVSTLPGCVCRKVKDMGPFFRLQVSEMSDIITLQMGGKFATSLNMGGRLPQKPYIFHVEMHYQFSTMAHRTLGLTPAGTICHSYLSLSYYPIHGLPTPQRPSELQQYQTVF